MREQNPHGTTLLYRRLKDHESFFLSPSNLQDLGIQASQVDITDDGILQFQPCFFRPYPERVLQLYPLDTSAMTEGLPELYDQPDFASILAKVLLEYPDAEDPLKVARNAYEERALVRSPDEWRPMHEKRNTTSVWCTMPHGRDVDASYQDYEDGKSTEAYIFFYTGSPIS